MEMTIEYFVSASLLGKPELLSGILFLNNITIAIKKF